MFERLKKSFKNLKGLKLVLRSRTYLVIVVSVSLVPMILVIFAWIYTWASETGING